MSITLLHDLPAQHAAAAATIYADAFASKMTAFLGSDRPRMEALFADSFQPQHTILALEADQVLGVLGMHDGTTGFLEPTITIMNRHYGWSGIFRLLGLGLLSSKHPKDSLHVESIAVSAAARGKGIGSQLLAHAEAHAINNGFRAMSLEVIGKNPRARALYERIGYQVIHTSIVPIGISHLIGVNSVHLMQKPLTP